MFVVKECTKCKEYKLLEEFGRSKNKCFGLEARCRLCRKGNYNKNREIILEKAKDYREKNRELISEKNKQKYQKNRELFSERSKRHYQKNRELIIEKQKQYEKENRSRRNEYIRNKRQTNHLFKLRCNIQTLIGVSIRKRGYTKKSRTHQMLGCDFETFKLHIEKQFTKGMSWDNMGEWHLDHIIPVSLAKDEQHLIELNHYTNFQPLWAKDNLSKGNKIVEKQLFLL